MKNKNEEAYLERTLLAKPVKAQEKI